MNNKPATVTISIIGLLILSGCGKDYIVHTERDKYGNDHKVVSTQEVLHDNSIVFGQDITTELPMTCKFSAIGWNGKLDKEQCSREHVHLTGANKGMTHYTRSVHASDTIVKKAVAGLWAMLFFIPNLVGSHGDQNVTQNQSANHTSNNAFNDNVQVNVPVPNHSVTH